MHFGHEIEKIESKDLYVKTPKRFDQILFSKGFNVNESRKRMYSKQVDYSCLLIS